MKKSKVILLALLCLGVVISAMAAQNDSPTSVVTMQVTSNLAAIAKLITALF